MFKFIVSILISFSLVQIQCSSAKKEVKPNEKSLLLGVWERVGSKSAGLMIKVYQINGEKSFIGKVIIVPERYNELVSYGDILWQDVTPSGTNQWQGIYVSRSKGVFSDKVSVENLRARFVLVNKDLLEVYISDKTLKYLRKDENEIYPK